MNNIQLICYMLVGLGFVAVSLFLMIRLVDEVRKIKIGKCDNYVKAVVVNWRCFTTGDITPIVMYKVNGVEKIYRFHFVHNRKEYPIGKEIYLQLSSTSGLAYDKKDLKQGFCFIMFAILFFGCGLTVGIIYILLLC